MAELCRVRSRRREWAREERTARTRPRKEEESRFAAAGLPAIYELQLSRAVVPASPEAEHHGGRSAHVLHMRETGKEKCRRFGAYAIEDIFAPIAGQNAAAIILLNRAM